MLLTRKDWRLVLAFVTVTAFVAAAGHEYVHTKHTNHCTACQFNHTETAPAPIASALAAIFVILFFLKPVSPLRPLMAGVFRSAGRDPPAQNSQ